jgi:hypothetical protein
VRVYVASSWRNPGQAGIVHILRRCGHDVYDFRHPALGNDGFHWTAIDPGWKAWTPQQYREALRHPIARESYELDMAALRACDACALVLPAGRSANWEFGYAMGQGKLGVVVQFGHEEPELMYREAAIITNVDELVDAFGGLTEERAPGRCPYRSSITDVQCTLPDGHPCWDATRFHRFEPPAKEPQCAT